MTTTAWGGQLAAEALVREGVTAMFGLTGGHVQALQDFSYRAGIDVYQVRHEQAGVFAADAYARITRRPGVCFGTAGPGMLNMATGIHLAYMARSPVVCLLGGHRSMETDRGALQEADAASVLGSITKWTRRCYNVEQASFYIRKAFRDAMTPPYGPVAIEFPLDSFNWEPIERADQVAYLADDWRASCSPRVLPDPALMAQVVDRLARAERPLLIAGDDVHWDEAGAELRDVAERLRIPVNMRRMSRGAVPEHLDVVVPSAIRKPLIREADVIVLLGLSVGYFESFGEWRSGAEFIQVCRNPGDVATHLPTFVELQADARSFLAHLLDRGAAVGAGAQAREPWLGRVVNDRQAAAERRAVDAASQDATRPVHPGSIARAVSAQLPEGMPVVLDSFTASAFLSADIELTTSGQMIDAGLSAAVGHGVGMGVGASIATGNQPVVVLMGDGGMGIGGGDIETAVRLNLPVVYLIYNNSALCAGLEKYCYGEGFRVLGPKSRGGWNLTQDVRYDLMYAPLGCYTENIDQPEQLDRVLARALESGRTAVINIIGARDVIHPLYDNVSAKEMFWHLPADEVEAPVRNRHLNGHYPQFHGGSAAPKGH
jgi:acetolactate synthase-1/2/3 large subunit